MTIGKEYNHTFVVNESIYLGFINLFDDKNILHVDNDYAVSKGFVAKVMHGNILNGFISYFVGEILEHKNVIIHTQSIQFKAPVYLNDTLSFIAVVEEVIESVNVVIFKFHFTNTLNKKVATGKIQIGTI
jgi:3-hydroxybutyryl-CoA dehydratase